MSDLYFIIGDRHCSFGILEHSTRKLQQLSYYLIDGRSEVELTELFARHPEINVAFHNTMVCYHYTQSVLAPSHLNDMESPELILESVYGPSFNNIIVSEKIGEWQITNSYYVPENIHKLLGNKFENGKFRHEYSVALKTLLMETGQADSMVVDFMPDQFTVYVLKHGQIQLAQKQLYKNPEDLIYHLVNICQQLSLNRQTVKVLISGLIDKDSAIYNSLQNYFIEIDFRNAIDEIQIDESINIHPAHFFVTLFNLSRCV